MKSTARLVRNEHQKLFIKKFDSICGRHNRWSVWADFVTLTAIEFSNAVDKSHAEERGKMYRNISGKYNEKELRVMADMLMDVVNGMEENPDQDFLGELYMCLELGNDHAGQFFTPYDVCKAMTKIATPDIKCEVSKRGWMAANDPACGAGATLVAFANECREQGVNFQTSVLFVAQDIDYTAGLMCYIQLSLMGCAGYICIANTLTSPCTSYDGRGLLPRDNGQIWYTPMYCHEIWHWRRVWARMDLLFKDRPLVEPHRALPEVEQVNTCLVEEKPPKPVATPLETKLSETKHGQLSFF